MTCIITMFLLKLFPRSENRAMGLQEEVRTAAYLRYVNAKIQQKLRISKFFSIRLSLKIVKLNSKRYLEGFVSSASSA